MTRTTVLLPEDLRLRATMKAHRIGISLGELIRQSLASVVRGAGADLKNDPLFSDKRVYTGKAPRDAAKEHDQHLYGEAL